MKNLILIIFLNILVQFSAFSQGGSNYSLFGIGDLNRNGGAFYDGMGGTSISVPSEYAINMRNPAMWSYNENTRLQFGYKFNQHLNESANQTLYQNNGKLNDVLAIFSIDTSLGISVSMGLYSYTAVNYYVSSKNSLTNGDLTVSGETRYQGSGGISNAYLGMSIRPLEYLSIGASVTGHLGNIKSLSQTRYNEDFAFLSVNNRTTAYRGLSTRLGFNFTGIENLSIGSFININSNMNATSTLEYFSQFQADTTTLSRTNFALPTELGFGLAYKTGKFIIATDLITQNFSNFDFNQRLNTNYQNNLNLSLGVRRLPNTNRSAATLDKLGYSFGLTYSNLYYNVNNTNISELSGSFGINIPIPGTGMIDMTLFLGNRGTTDNGLINEYFGRYVVNMSIGDTWFKPIRKYFD